MLLHHKEGEVHVDALQRRLPEQEMPLGVPGVWGHLQATERAKYSSLKEVSSSHEKDWESDLFRSVCCQPTRGQKLGDSRNKEEQHGSLRGG